MNDFGTTRVSFPALKTPKHSRNVCAMSKEFCIQQEVTICNPFCFVENVKPFFPPQ